MAGGFGGTENLDGGVVGLRREDGGLCVSPQLPHELRPGEAGTGKAEGGDCLQQAGPSLAGLVGHRAELAIAGPGEGGELPLCGFNPLAVGAAAGDFAVSPELGRLETYKEARRQQPGVAGGVGKEGAEVELNGEQTFAAQKHVGFAEAGCFGGVSSCKASGEQAGDLGRGKRASKPAEQKQGGCDDGHLSERRAE